MKREDTPMWNDPEESEYVRDLLDAGRNAPADYDVSRGLAAHLAHVQAGTPLPHWAKAASGGMSTGTLVAWVAIPVVTASIVAGVYLTRERQVQPSAAPAVATQAPIDAAPPAPLQPAPAPVLQAAPTPRPALHEVQAPVSAPQGVDTGAKGTTRAPAAQKPVRSEAAAKAVGASSPAAKSQMKSVSPAAVSAPHPVRVTESDVIERMMSASAKERAGSEAQRKPEADAAEPQASKTAAEATTTDDSRLEREMRMLAVAQRVLSEDPQRALRMAEQGEREFPRSMFSAERQQVALLAMVKLGRIDEARRIGRPFLAKYPNAPWSARLRRALATGQVE